MSATVMAQAPRRVATEQLRRHRCLAVRRQAEAISSAYCAITERLLSRPFFQHHDRKSNVPERRPGTPPVAVSTDGPEGPAVTDGPGRRCHGRPRTAAVTKLPDGDHAHRSRSRSRERVAPRSFVPAVAPRKFAEAIASISTKSSRLARYTPTRTASARRRRRRRRWRNVVERAAIPGPRSPLDCLRNRVDNLSETKRRSPETIPWE